MAVPGNDAFGDLLRRCSAEGSATEIVERDDGHVSRGEAARYFHGPEFWSAGERALLDLASGRVLDMGCGAGRHMAALHQRGVRVHGVDPSPGAVAVCRARGLTADVGDIDSPPAGPYDTLLLMGGNLGLLGSPALAPRRLAAMAAVAAPGARLLGSNINPYLSADPEHAGYHARNMRLGRAGGSCGSGSGTATRSATGSTTGWPASPNCGTCSGTPGGAWNRRTAAGRARPSTPRS